MVAANSGSEATGCEVRRYFSGGKDAVLGIQQEWKGREVKEIAESDAMTDGPWYAVTDTGDAYLGG